MFLKADSHSIGLDFSAAVSSWHSPLPAVQIPNMWGYEAMRAVSSSATRLIFSLRFPGWSGQFVTAPKTAAA